MPERYLSAGQLTADLTRMQQTAQFPPTADNVRSGTNRLFL